MSEPSRGRFNYINIDEAILDDSGNEGKFMSASHNFIKIIKNFLFIMIAIGASFRFFGGYALGFWAAKYFRNHYINYQSEFSIFSSCSILILGMISAYTGGVISDYFDESNINDPKMEHRAKPQCKALIVAVGGAIAFPMILIAFSFSSNFWLSITLYSLSFLSAEMWLVPAIAMIQSMFKAELVGTAIAVFYLIGSFAGALSIFLVGVLNDRYVTNEDTKVEGNIVTIFTGVSYLGCIPFFVY